MHCFSSACVSLFLVGNGLFATLPCHAAPAPAPLPTGRFLSPLGAQTDVGSFPANMALSPDGRFVLVTNVGAREYVSVLRADSGALVSRLDWNTPSPVFPHKKRALYFGLVCGAAHDGQTPVYVSCGGEGTVAVLSLASNGTLTDSGRTLGQPADANKPLAFLAGLSLSSDGARLYAADNSANPTNGMRGALQIIDVESGKVAARVALPGYALAVAATHADKVYVSSEQSGVVSVVNGRTGRVECTIATGMQPAALLLDRAGGRLFVSNAGSDTLSIVDTRTHSVTQTLLLRPTFARGLPGATPLGMALSPNGRQLYIAIADLNAVAVVRLNGSPNAPAHLAGFLPVGWYPTSAIVAPNGHRLFVANAKGARVANPNAHPKPGLKARPQYILNIIEGTVSTLDLHTLPQLNDTTAQVIHNARGIAGASAALANPGIKHVFYVIKENRTYDQVLGDIPGGNGDPALTLFGRAVTPNLHALAERFALLDNFYCCAEVSGDGWNWSTGGMVSEFSARNVPHNYGGRQRPYDFEGTNNGIAINLLGIPDAGRLPGGYLWDLCAAHGVSYRNYGFFTDDLELPRTLPEEGTKGFLNTPTQRALMGHSDADFRQFDLTYPDSEAWSRAGVAPAPKQTKSYGSGHYSSRFSAWKREFDDAIKSGTLPALTMLRFMRDHTSGTAPGFSSPSAMVADNDFAVGQLVEAISHSPVWKSSAIVVVEDDAQNGFDHVDAHRSTAYVISPFVRGGTYSRFGNTDSALRTVEVLLGLPPMTSYDANAAPLAVFGARPDNAAPYTAILPPRAILSEVNTAKAPLAAQSARLLNPLREESAPDEKLNEILWRALKGRAPMPRRSAPSGADD